MWLSKMRKSYYVLLFLLIWNISSRILYAWERLGNDKRITINYDITPAPYYMGLCLSAQDRCDVTYNGTITASESYGTGIGLRCCNTLVVNGVIKSTDLFANCIESWDDGTSNGRNNNITVTGTLMASAKYCSGIYLEGRGGDVCNISGKIYTVSNARYCIGAKTKEAVTINILDGADLTGKIYSRANSYMTFGYGKDSNNNADLGSVDNSFDYTCKCNITGCWTREAGNWSGYFAGGSTTFNSSSSSFRHIYIGADCFDGVEVPNGNNGYDNGSKPISAKLEAISGATAVLNLNRGKVLYSNISVIVGSGSVLNVNGTHKHRFENRGSYQVLGTVNIGTGGRIVNSRGNHKVVLTLGGVNSSGSIVDATLNSSAANQSMGLVVYSGATGNVNVDAGTLTLTSINNNGILKSTIASGATLVLHTDAGSINEINLAGTLQTDVSQTISALNCKSGDTGKIKVAGGTLNLTGIANYGTLNADIASGATLALSTNAGTVAMVNLAGTLQTGVSQVIGELNCGNGRTGNISVAGGALTLSSINNRGTLNAVVSNGGALILSTGTGLDMLDLAGTLQTEDSQTIGTLECKSGATGGIVVAGGTLSLNNISNSGTLNADIAAGSTLELGGDAGLNMVVLAGELQTSVSQAIGSVICNSGDTGKINVAGGTLNLTGIANHGTLNADIASGATLALSTNAGTVAMVNLAGTLQTGVSQVIGELNCSSGDTGNISVAGGALTLSSINNSGTLNAVVSNGGALILSTGTGLDMLDLAGTLQTEDSQTIGTLECKSGATGGIVVAGGTLSLNNISNSGTLNADIAAGSTLELGGDAGLNMVVLAGELQTSVSQAIGSVICNSGDTGKINVAGGALNLTDIAGRGTLNADIASGAKLVLGGSAYFDTVKLAGTLETKAQHTIEKLECNSGATGSIKINSGELWLNNISNRGTLNADIAAASTLVLRADAGLNTVNLAGTLLVEATQSINSVNSSGSSNIDINAGSLTLDSLSNSGVLNINVGKTATFNTNSSLNLAGSNSLLTLDLNKLGRNGIHARVCGAFKSAGDSTADAPVMSSIQGNNGYVGVTYRDVFDTAVVDENGVSFGEGAVLGNTEDRYRYYVLAANSSGSLYDIRVDNSNRMRQDILNLGGSRQDAEAANYLIENQGKFDLIGSSFVDRFATLSGQELLRGAQELIGEDATTAITQAALSGVRSAMGAVGNKLMAFRSGNVAGALASSFGSGGATAALGDMAEAAELAEAYAAAASGNMAAAESIYHKATVWADGYGGWGEQGSEGYTPGYDFWNIGFMGGIDYAFARELRIGALFGYSHNKTDIYGGRGSSADEVLRLGAYASYNWDNFFVDLSPSLGIHFIESERNLILNGRTAKGERTGVDFNISSRVGYTFELPAEFRVTPSYSLGYTCFHDPAYAETGAGIGDLQMDSFTSNSLVQDLGARIGRLCRVNENLAFLPEVWGGWEVEYLNTGGSRNSTTSATIGSQSYATTMNGLAPHRGYWGAGVTALIKDNVSVYGRYDQKAWDKGYNAGFSMGIKVSF